MMYAPKETTKIKTAKALGLTQEYWEGLWTVLYKLEHGWFKQTEGFEHGPNHFNMAIGWAKSECGSVGCMMGWAMHFSGVEYPGDYPLISGCTDPYCDRLATKHLKAHSELTCPPFYSTRPDWYSIKRCAPVLRRYLETGEVVW